MADMWDVHGPGGIHVVILGASGTYEERDFKKLEPDP